MKMILWRFFALALALPLLAATARANVYATDIKLNGYNDLVNPVPPGAVIISYILNETADLGVTIRILNSTTVIQTISLAPGAPGTMRGVNQVEWNSYGSNSYPAPPGNYYVNIIAASTGHTTWTQISRDSDAANYVFDPRGVAVDNNPNSIYYGRVFVSSAGTGPNFETTPGDMDTILKLNSDSTFADEGPSGNGGFAGIFDDGNGDVPQKLRVGDDDRLYMNDLTSYGEVVAFDPELTTNQVVFDQYNYYGNPFYGSLTQGGGSGWFSMDVTAASTTNGLIWLGDIDAGGAGVWNWHLINGVADTNDDTGNWAVATGGSLSVAASGGFMVDDNFDIFVGQFLADTGDTNPACMVFTNWNHALAYNGNPVTNSTAWIAGTNDSTFLGVFDTTIDSRLNPTYVACALTNGPVYSGIEILSAATGETIVSNLDGINQYYATAWDNVGNLYGVTASAHLLRIYSPPDGANQAGTFVPIQLMPGIVSITQSGGYIMITLVTVGDAKPAHFSLVSAPDLAGPYELVTDDVLIQPQPYMIVYTVPKSLPAEFFQILVH
jgi:hypothetical protein